MKQFTHFRTPLYVAAACALIAGCTAPPPGAHPGRYQLVKSIEPELRLLGVPTDGLDTYRNIRLAQLKAIIDERPPEHSAQRTRAMVVINKARAEPGYSK